MSSSTKDFFSHSAAVLGTTDMPASLEFYYALGFSAFYLHEDPCTYAVLKRGGVTLNLTLVQEVTIPGHSAVYIFCFNIESLHTEYNRKDVPGLSKLVSTDYGMTEFEVQDPMGYTIVFGHGK